MLNPYKEFRLNLNLTQADVASIAGVPRQLVGKIESYLYFNPPPRVTEALLKVQVRTGRSSGIATTSEGLEGAYRVARYHARKASISDFNLEDYIWDAIIEVSNPWDVFRRSVNPALYGFATSLAFDISMLQAYEKDRVSNKPAIFEALSEVLPELRLHQLKNAVVKHER